MPSIVKQKPDSPPCPLNLGVPAPSYCSPSEWQELELEPLVSHGLIPWSGLTQNGRGRAGAPAAKDEQLTPGPWLVSPPDCCLPRRAEGVCPLGVWRHERSGKVTSRLSPREQGLGAGGL